MIVVRGVLFVCLLSGVVCCCSLFVVVCCLLCVVVRCLSSSISHLCFVVCRLLFVVSYVLLSVSC